MEVFRDKKHQKNIKQFVCEDCHFSCCKKGDWNRHILRAKHLNLTSSNILVTEKTSKSINICELCSKEYKSRNGLWSHKKYCQKVKEQQVTTSNPSNIITTELVLELIKDNKEMKQIILYVNIL